MEASIEFLLKNVTELIKHHVILKSEAGKELKALKDDLELMKAKLKDVSMSNDYGKGEVFEIFEGRIRKVVYEVEDVIDECMIQSVAENAKWSTSSLIGKRALGNYINKTKMAEKVKNLRINMVKPMFAEAQTTFANFGGASQMNAGTAQIVDKRNKLPRRDNIVGFKDVISDVLGCLRANSEKLEVTSISGMPGLGKTTVAWKIYTDSELVYEFPIRIWVNVSQAFNKMDVILKILKQFTKDDMSRKDEDELVKAVKEHLGTKKILLFLDDVWEDWSEIKSFLPENKLCKVLVTTRHVAVGWDANRTKGPYKLRFLNPEESWELLQLEVGVEVFADDTHLTEIGQGISAQCYGLPLSIVIIGGIMVGKIGIAGGPGNNLWEEWQTISESVKTSLNEDDEHKRMDNIISLSYTKLPYEFRDLFLYLGMFPSGIEIPSWKLTRMWIAEGLIPEKSGKTPEQVADDILKELICRNLLMVHETKMNGHVKTCRLHDSIREFCRIRAGSKNHNLFHEIKLSKASGHFEPPSASMQNCRRLCIHSHLLKFLAEKVKVPKARSFSCFNKEDVRLKPDEIQPLIEAFNLLRVFEAGTVTLPQIPSSIDKLYHLRYVTLCVRDLDVLPRAISGLYNLQMLTIDTNHHSLNIKADLLNMIHLRHLKTKASIVLSNTKEKGTRESDMQTLAMLSTESCTDKVLKRVKNLTALGITGDLPKLLKSMSFDIFNRLEKLKLVNKVYMEVASENPLPELPKFEYFTPKLRSLTLSATHLKWEEMEVLKRLGNLMVLKLKENAFVGISWNSEGEGFSFLETLYINQTNLETWTATDNAFPRLKNLIIKSCGYLVKAPFSQLKKLEMLSLERVTPSAVSCALGVTKGNFQLHIAPQDKPQRS